MERERDKGLGRGEKIERGGEEKREKEREQGLKANGYVRRRRAFFFSLPLERSKENVSKLPNNSTKQQSQPFLKVLYWESSL